LQKDDFRTTYHPHSGWPIEVEPFKNYGRARPKPPPGRSTMPWLPFHSETEFSFAEIVLESAMSDVQGDALIKVIHTLLKDKEEVFIVQNHKELEKLWVGASDELVPVCPTYQLNNITFDHYPIIVCFKNY
jgi:hypothetical protein